MSSATSTTALEHIARSTLTDVARAPRSETPAREAQAAATAGDWAPLDRASSEGGGHARDMAQRQGYFPTPSPAPSPAGTRRPSTNRPAPHDQVDDDDIESDTDSLSSADTDMADAATIPENRKTVLFPDLAVTFPTSEQFFDACRSRLYVLYGLAIERYWSSEMSATVKCERRLDASRCPFTVRALEEDGLWSLEEDACVWEHSHGPKGLDEAPGEGSGCESGASSDDSEWDSEWEDSRRGRLGIVVGKISGPWAAKTDSELVRHLVNSRADIFAKQRSCQHPVLVASSQRAVDKLIADASSGNNLPRAAFGNYERFCAAQHIPVFPITPAVVALWLVDKCSTTGDGYFLTYTRLLVKIVRLVEPGWSASSTYRDLLAYDPDGDAVEEFLLERKPTGPTTQYNKKRRRSTASSTSSASTDASDHVSTANDFLSSDRAVSESSGRCAKSQNIPVPGLPRPGDSFGSAQDVYGAFVRAILPVYGIGVASTSTSESMIIKCNRYSAKRCPPGARPCPHRVEAKRDERTGRWIVADDASEAQHSHGPAAQILRDPSWRPRVRSAEARAALGMRALSSVGKLTKRGVRVQGKGKGGARTIEQARSKNKNRKSRPSMRKKQRVADRERSPVNHGRQAARLGAAPSPARDGLKQVFPGAQHAPSTFHHTAITPPFPAGPSLAPRRPPLSSSAVVDVEAFLLALHPSLAPLAPHLVIAGCDSADRLVALGALDPAILDLTLDLLRLRPGACSATTGDVTLSPASVIQLKLLSRLLKEQGAAFRST